MGEELTKRNDGVKSEADRSAEGKDGARGTSSTATKALNNGSRTVGGSAGGSEGRAEAGTEKLVVSPVSTVTDEERKREERNARRRERYAEQKGGTVKPRKVRGTKKKADAIDTTEIDKLIVAVSSVVASRPDMAHWQLSEVEAHSISQPLANVLQKYGAFEKVTENSNEIALGVACVSVFAPRIMLTVAQMKAKPKTNIPVSKKEVKDDGKSKAERNAKSDDRHRNDGITTNDSTSSVNLPTYFSSGY